MSIENSTICTFGNFRNSMNFNVNSRWFKPGVIPFANTVSGLFRTASNVAFLGVNLVRIPCSAVGGLKQRVFSEKTTYFAVTKDSTKALGLNILAAAGGLVEAVPIVGNSPYWTLNCVVDNAPY